MNISAISALQGNDNSKPVSVLSNKNVSTNFDNLLQSMMSLINETNDLSNAAEEEEIKYAAGEDNTLELMLAQNKANLSLSFTVAVRDKVVEAYKEIMNLQF